MNKLELALEKSRQQRAQVLGQNPHNPNVGPNLNPIHGSFARMAEVHAPSPAAPAFDATKIDEAQMERNRIVAHHTRSTKADIYRQLRTQVLQIMNKSGFRTLAITSPQYGDGKTTVALNLSVSIALDLKQTVLLADLDLRKPSTHKYLGMEPQAGLTDYLLRDTPLQQCLMRTPFERLNTLPAGLALDNSSELLGSPKMIALAKAMKARYPDRLIIYDMPPVLAQDDSIAFLPQVDAVLVVVRDGVTSIDDLKRCLNTLANANVIGTVLNNCW